MTSSPCVIKGVSPRFFKLCQKSRTDPKSLCASFYYSGGYNPLASVLNQLYIWDGDGVVWNPALNSGAGFGVGSGLAANARPFGFNNILALNYAVNVTQSAFEAERKADFKEESTWRKVAGFVPIVGSGLDAYDAFSEGRWGMGIVHSALAVTDLFGAGAIIKGLTVGTMKFSARALVKSAYKNTNNWNSMRRVLQRGGVIAKNSKATVNRAWVTTDHIFIKQGRRLPHWLTNHPANLQTGVSKRLNSQFEFMSRWDRAKYLPGWMKAGAAGGVSYGTGLMVDEDE